MNFERKKLPDEILKFNLEEKRKYFSDINIETEKSEAEVQVYAEPIICLLLSIMPS